MAKILLVILISFGAASLAQLIPFGFWTIHNVFTWVGGPNVISMSAVWGTKGTGSTANTPSARDGVASWTDSSGNLWFFGGYSFDLVGDMKLTNDLWKYDPSSGQWAWMSGFQTGNYTGTYGTKGVGSTDNIPGARRYAASFADTSGNLWLFGGDGWDESDWSSLSDLWKYTISTGKWTWMGGPKTVSLPGSYGTKGTGSTANYPGARSNPAGIVDASGNVWIFGGWGHDTNNTEEDLNDLWEFTPGNSQWMWVSGAKTAASGGSFGSLGVGSTAFFPGARNSHAVWFDATYLWVFGGFGNDSNASAGSLNDLWKYEFSTKKWTWVAGSKTKYAGGTYGSIGVGSTANSPGARSRPGFAQSGSGTFWLFGGFGYDAAPAEGMLNDLWRYTTSDGKWTWMSGKNAVNSVGTLGTKGVASTSNVPSPRYDVPGLATDSSGNVYMFSGLGWDSQGIFTSRQNDLWKFDPTASTWTWLTGSATNSEMPVAGTLGVASTANLPSARTLSEGWVDSSGNFWLFGGYAIDSGGTPMLLNDLWKYNPSNGQWTWMNGSLLGTPSGTYGTKGTGSTANLPGARNSAVTWTDGSGNLWMFGGYGSDAGGTSDELNDLWKFNPTSGQWTWMHGSSSAPGLATYGTKGTPTTTTVPGGREGAASFTDSSGNLWLFGGWSVDKNGAQQPINDLWKYDPTVNKWTWMTGSNIVAQPAVYGTKGVGSTANTPGARNLTGYATDLSGNFWIFGGYAYDTSGTNDVTNDLWRYTPSDGKWTWMSGPNTTGSGPVYGTQGVGSTSNYPGSRNGGLMWCDTAGNLWLFGGSTNTSNGSALSNDLWRYEIATGKWAWIGGPITTSTKAVFGSKGVPAYTNIPGGRYQGSVLWRDSKGTAWFFGGQGYDTSGQGFLNDLWKYTP